MTILLTGFTGNVGLELARGLRAHRLLALVRDPQAAALLSGVELVDGSLETIPPELAPEIEIIVHAAASTAFRASLAEARTANLHGTEHVLAFARRCPRLRRLIHLSTVCACGDGTGHIAEAPFLPRPQFINTYEQTKWEAEQAVLASGLPAEIARLSIVTGSQRDGSVRRPGALHHALFWLYKGLIPILPGQEHSAVDLISTEYAGTLLSALLQSPAAPGRIVHLAAGDHAPPLGELLDFLATLFRRHHHGWATDAIAPPQIVDGETFALFERSVRQSGDLLFLRVVEDARSFLPMLLHPRIFETSLARSYPPPDWRTLVERTFTWLVTHDWGRAPHPTPSPHVHA